MPFGNTMSKIHCPLCDLEFSPIQHSEALPFCSKRCKLVDQKRWLGEEYGLPYESEDSKLLEYEEMRESLDLNGL